MSFYPNLYTVVWVPFVKIWNDSERGLHAFIVVGFNQKAPRLGAKSFPDNLLRDIDNFYVFIFRFSSPRTFLSNKALKMVNR